MTTLTTRKTAILKFGGTSVSNAELREIAILRVKEAHDRGYAPVAVCSAMGRAPDPYATDTLLSLVGDALGNPNTDLLLSCGELLSAAMFAQMLSELGMPALAFTGAQAGIITNDAHGDAKILRVDPQRILDALSRGVTPVVAGFQGVSEMGHVTTLGRGGTDLSAIALGHALNAERIDIYTDVSGAMTADPRRVEGAHPIERASLEEMTELAEHGAKIMHHKAAEFARSTQTAYAIKGLKSDIGTIVDESEDHQRVVVGVTASGRQTFVRIIRGDVETPQARMALEMRMFERIAQAGISIDQSTINQSGVCFVVEGDEGPKIRQLLSDLNMAVRIREGCSKLSVVGAGMRYAPGVLYRVVTALSESNVEIIHCTDSNITISVLVPADEVSRAEQAVHDQFHLDAGAQQ
ncbi:MAG: aspartate kinase [Candidatus Eremiobacteraeota bacterium]|nr:aspartate kinase [Candidatus Eremiobacteraeota bacterium]